MKSGKSSRQPPPGKRDIEAMSAFRYDLRKFLRASEEIANAAGITTLQYQLLLHVYGFPDRQWATVGELAERLQAAPNGTAALVSRCESAGLVTRTPDPADGRQVQIRLTPKGERFLLELAAEHKALYGAFGWIFGNMGS
ncbi:MarR family winged helix-turn-helix transcriptional regulator [Paraburkholderia sp. BL25I1N1]|uniref:MarR family winged helix-turn-helix transcriptional regulator n=1 Tax=Paraburkholderia sp. BL25I1N1 TaxID=1938804 RepID=UPI000D0729D3|nr:MarR family winged helix-turn-helix transcriptional regulator [Paraburkholderia sp. BL25I1N1]PRY08561.1 DNA-binding MarR family transcriptional regulator [Paraburkholderia sp. BL25I1N1]